MQTSRSAGAFSASASAHDGTSFDDLYLQMADDLEAVEKDIQDRLNYNSILMTLVGKARSRVEYVDMEVRAGNIDAAICLPGAYALATKCDEPSLALDVLDWLDNIQTNNHSIRGPLSPDELATLRRQVEPDPEPDTWSLRGAVAPPRRAQQPSGTLPASTVPLEWSSYLASGERSHAGNGDAFFGTNSSSSQAQYVPSTLLSQPLPARTMAGEIAGSAEEENDHAEASLADVVAGYPWPTQQRRRGPNTNGSIKAARRKRRQRAERAMAAATSGEWL